MKVSIVVTLCHALLAQPAEMPVCQDDVAFDTNAIGIGCLIGEAQVIEWKEHSIYRGPQWTIWGVPRCAPGGYRLKLGI
jgi:hypothetical protein